MPLTCRYLHKAFHHAVIVDPKAIKAVIVSRYYARHPKFAEIELVIFEDRIEIQTVIEYLYFRHPCQILWFRLFYVSHLFVTFITC